LEQLKLDHSHIILDDDQLIGFIPYIVSKELDLSLDDAWSLANVFTKQDAYVSCYHMFDSILENLKEKGLKHAIKQSLILGPKEMQTSLEKAIDIKNTDEFINAYAGRACSIKDGIPVIIHILYHSKSFEDAINLNAKIGGASADRALLLGALLNQVYDIPESWIEKALSI
jgi:hypothetical protein